jgi:hypothetical protein
MIDDGELIAHCSRTHHGYIVGSTDYSIHVGKYDLDTINFWIRWRNYWGYHND